MGSGQNIKFWEDNWARGKSVAYKKFRILMETLKAKVGMRVVDYIDPRRKWKKLRKDNCPLEDIPLLEELEELMEP